MHPRTRSSRHRLAEEQCEFGSLARLGADGDLCLVGLDDAIDDGEAEAGSALKAGLKRLENLFDELGRDASAGVLKTDAPVALELVERRR